MFIKTMDGIKEFELNNIVISGPAKSGKTRMCRVLIEGLLESVRNATAIICNNEEYKLYHDICSEYPERVTLMNNIEEALDIIMTQSEMRISGLEDGAPIVVFVDGVVPDIQDNYELVERLLKFNRNSKITNVYLVIVSNQQLLIHNLPIKVFTGVAMKKHSYLTASMSSRYWKSLIRVDA